MGTITAELVETGEKRDVRGRRVMPAAERARLVEAYQASGLTMWAFAKKEAINYTTLAGWVAKAGKRPEAPAPIRFAQFALPAGRTAQRRESAPLEVRLADGTVVRGGRVSEIAALVRALRS
jgi:transposase-like protein